VALGQEERIARRYAKALFDASEPSQFDAVEAQLSQLVDLWNASADFRESNLNPRVTDSQRAEVVEAVVSSLGGWKTEQLHRTVQILVSLRKTIILPQLSALFAAYVREYRKNLAIEISSATEVSSQDQQAMKEKLSSELGGAVTLTVKHTPELIGGVTLRLGDRYLDRSIAGTLARIAGQISK
jgi:F-type H+-transporting ATPase subunit delta